MRMLNKFLRSKKAAGGVIVTLISMMVMLLVGIVIVNALINSQVADDTWSTEANATWANTQTNIWLAFSLVVIGLIIVGAVAILSYLNFGGAPAA
jgi:hypothetical protein